MDKRGLDTVSFFIAIIILGTSLVILLSTFFFSGIDDNIDEQACLASVQARSSFNVNEIFEPGRDYLPLNCKTEKIKVVLGEGDVGVSGFVDSKENQVQTIELDDGKPIKPQVFEIISNNLYDCHKMLGQGQLNFLPSEAFPKNYCLICDHIVLDTKAREAVGEVSFIEFYRYMATQEDSSGRNYLEYVYGVDNPNQMHSIIVQSLDAQGDARDPSSYTFDFGYGRGFTIMAQQRSKSSISQVLTLVGGAATGVGATLIILGGPVSWAATGIAAGVLVISATAGDDIESYFFDGQDYLLVSGPVLVSRTPDGAGYTHPTFYQYDAEVLRGLECHSFEVAP